MSMFLKRNNLVARIKLKECVPLNMYFHEYRLSSELIQVANNTNNPRGNKLNFGNTEYYLNIYLLVK